MAKKRKVLHPTIKRALGFPPEMPDREVLSIWRTHATKVCKPCWELKYCSYGPLVEHSPLLPSTLEGATEHNEYMKNCLATGLIEAAEPLSKDKRQTYEQAIKTINLNDYEDDPTGELTPMQRIGRFKDLPLTRQYVAGVIEQWKRALECGVDGERLDPARRKIFRRMIKSFNESDHPDEIPQEIAEMQCNVYGHICPVVFNARRLTETAELRRSKRYIPFKTKVRVVRRDNYTCQHCGKHLLDNEVEFDHIIPVAKGGSSEEHNLRLTCFDCNRDKSDKVTI